MKMGLRALLFIFLAAAALVMLYVPYLEIQDKTTAKLNERQMLLAKQAAFGIGSFFNEQRNLLSHFASSSAFRELSPHAFETMKREIDQHGEYIKAVTVYDKNGIIQYSYPHPELSIGRDISQQAHVKKILREHKTNLSDVFNAVQGFKAVALSEPMFDDGEFVGVVAFLINFEHIAKTFLEVIEIGENGYAWMISRDGTELYFPVNGHSGRNVHETFAEFPSALEMAEEMMNGRTGVTTYTYDMIKEDEVGTVKKYAVYYPVNVFDNLWSIAVATPESEVTSELHSFYVKMLLAAGLIFASLAIFGYFLMKDYNLAKINKELEKRISEEMKKRQEQEKLMLQQAKFYSMTETLNAIAHQWRQPLNSIGLCVQDIEDTFEHGDASSDYISSIVNKTMNEVNSLSRTIDDFRTFYAPDENLTPTDLDTFLKSIVSLLKAQYDDAKIELSFESDQQQKAEAAGQAKPEIYPDILKQVVLNCLQNSKEAIQKRLAVGDIRKGRINIYTERENGDFAIIVTDNGGGISDSLVDKVFDPYFTTKDFTIGMGLGLYVSKNILEEHMNGSISLENYKDGTKAVIRFKAV